MAIGAGGSFVAGSIIGKLLLDKTGWNQSVSSVAKDEKALGGMSDRMAKKFQNIGKAMTIAGGAIMVSLGSMVNKASEAQETFSKFDTVFQDVLSRASQAAQNLAYDYGLSDLAAKTLLSSTGDLLTGLGLTGEEALTLSERTQQLAVDLASFTNYSGGAEGASSALTKAMLGERESVKALGIVITEEMVKEKLRIAGKSKLTGLALQQAKAEATLTIAISQSKNAIGDYARTSGSLANQKRLLTAKLENFSTTVGTTLIPVVTRLITKITETVTTVSDWIKENPKLTETIVKVAAAGGALMLVLGPFVMMLPGLIALTGAWGGAMSRLVIPIGLAYAAYKALIAIRDRAEKGSKEQQGKDAELRKWQELSRAVGGWTDFLQEAEKKEIISVERRRQLWTLYNQDFISGLKSISEGKEGPGLKKLLEEIGGKEYYAATGALDLSGALADLKGVLGGDPLGGLSISLAKVIREFGLTRAPIRTAVREIGKIKAAAFDVMDAWESIPGVVEESIPYYNGVALAARDMGNVHLTVLGEIESKSFEVYKSFGQGITEWAIKNEETLGAIAWTTMDYLGQINDISQMSFDNKMANLDIEYEKELAAIENSKKSEEEKKKAMLALDEKYDKKRKELQIKQAKANKAVALMGAIVNVAMGVTKALASSPPPFNIILAAITAALGAIQIGVIASQPIPAMAEGGIVSKPTYALIGERGPEAVIPLNKYDTSPANQGYNSQRQRIEVNVHFGDTRLKKEIVDIVNWGFRTRQIKVPVGATA